MLGLVSTAARHQRFVNIDARHFKALSFDLYARKGRAKSGEARKTLRPATEASATSHMHALVTQLW